MQPAVQRIIEKKALEDLWLRKEEKTRKETVKGEVRKEDVRIDEDKDHRKAT